MTAAKPRTPVHKRGGRAASGAKLRQVLQPKISKPSRSTKALTLPEEFELATTKRARSAKGPTAEAVRRLEGRRGAAAGLLLLRKPPA